METQECGAQSETVVLVVDDREQTLEAVESFFDAHGIRCVVAGNARQARERLDRWGNQICVAFVDKQLGIDEVNGIDFILDAVIHFPYVNFCLITAWGVEERELERVGGKRIRVLEKAAFSPEEYLRIYKAAVEGDDEPTVTEAPPAKVESEADAREVAFEYSLRHRIVQTENNRLMQRLETFSKDLVDRLRSDSFGNDEVIAFGEREFNTEDLVEEVKNNTPLGESLVDQYWQVMRDIIDRRRR